MFDQIEVYDFLYVLDIFIYHYQDPKFSTVFVFQQVKCILNKNQTSRKSYFKSAITFIFCIYSALHLHLLKGNMTEKRLSIVYF